MYADYEFYTEVFFGTAIAEADFPRLSSRASDFIDYYTRGKAAKVTDETILPALAKCCCAVAEQMHADEQAKALAALAVSKAIVATQGGVAGAPDHEIKSESSGGWSASYVTAADYAAQSARESVSDRRAAYASIASEYLTNTGLLYRGGVHARASLPFCRQSGV